MKGGFAYLSSYSVRPSIHQMASIILLRHHISNNDFKRYRNINLLSIAYAFRP